VFLMAFLALVVFVLLARRLSLFSLSQLNILSYANYSFLIFGVIGSILIGFFGVNHYLINMIDREIQIRVSSWIVLSYVYIFGIIAFVLRFLGLEKIFRGYYKKDVKNVLSHSIDILSALILMICVYYLLKLNPIETIGLIIQGDVSQLAVKRIIIARGGVRGLLFNAVSLMNLFFALYYMSVYLTHKRKFFFFVLHTAVVFATSFFLLEKAIIVFNGVAFVVLYATHKKISRKKISLAILMVLIVVLIQYFMFMGVNNSGQAFKTACYRTFIGQAAGAYLMMDYFGDSLSFLHGASISRLLSNLLGFEYLEPGRMLIEMLYPQNVEAGMAGRINSIFLGELYANFGDWSLVVICLVPVCFMFYFVFFYIMLPKDNLTVAFYATFVSLYSKSIITGFVYLIYSPIFVELLIAYLLLRTLALIGAYEYGSSGV